MSMLYKNVWRVCLSGVCMLVKRELLHTGIVELAHVKGMEQNVIFFFHFVFVCFFFFILKMTLGWPKRRISTLLVQVPDVLTIERTCCP